MKQMYPLTEAQSGLWYAQRLDPENPLFNTAHRVSLRGPLLREHFCAAVNQAVRESDALCLTFCEASGTTGQVQQYVNEQHRPWLQIVDVSAEADPEAAALASIERDANQALDPTQSALALERLYVLGPDWHIWYQRIHHLLIDGYGVALLNARIAELYNALLAGQVAEAPPFGELSVAFAEDEKYRQSDKRDTDAGYWRNYLANLDEVSGLVPGKAVSAHQFERASVSLSAELIAALRTRADQLQVPWPDLLTALASAYCQRFIDTGEVVVGIPHMGRLGSPLARVPAMVMNILPLRAAIVPGQTINEFVTALSRDMLRARRHGRYRSEQMRRDLGLLGGHRRLYATLINILPFDKPPAFNAVDASMHVMSTGPVDDMTLNFRGDAVSLLQLDVDLNPELYAAGQAQEHAQRLLVFMQRAMAVACLDEVALATEAEAQHFIHTVNQTHHVVADTTLSEMLETAMRQYADNTALGFADEVLTYAELEQRTRALALQLQSIFTRNGQQVSEPIVAVALPRSTELLIALIAVIRAGAAYLPLDMEHPAERLQKIIASARPALILAHADQELSQFTALGETPVLASTQWNTTATEDLLRVDSFSPASLAYVIYTSGSTGEPKGVMIEHRAIVNRLQWMQTHYGFDQHDRILQKTPAAFDVSVWEFFLPFITGASLVVAPPGAHRDPSALVSLIRQHQITTLHFVPSMLAVFLDEPAAAGLAVKRVFCSGEELGAELSVRFHRTVHAELHNLYGPTEAAVDVSYWPVEKTSTPRAVPIGFPVWNTRLYVLDEKQRPLPAGVTGHLYLAGVQLARGYLGREDLTSQRFVDDPFVAGERMYQTGDLARYRADNAVIYLGRSDHQVKIRGLRIELGEIEAAVMSSGLVSQSSVLVHEDASGNKRLVAHCVPHADYEQGKLKAHLLSQVPDYMVPAVFVEMDHLPTTSNGKLDRKALPAPAFSQAAGRPAQGLTEQILAALFAEVLGLSEPVYADSDFFSLGGDSLLAVQLTILIKQRLGRDPGLGALFDKPTVAALAQLMDSSDAVFDDGLQMLIRLSTGPESLAPLFVVHPVGGISWCYRQLAAALNPKRTVYGLQAPFLDTQTPVPVNIDALAARYVEKMIAVCPEGPYHVAGWSVGGIVAHAIAVRLQEVGKAVGVIAMFDSYPSESWRAEAAPSEDDALRALLAVAGFIPEDHPQLLTRDEVVGFLRESRSALGQLPDTVLDGVIHVVLETNRLVREHYHKPMQGTLLHLRAALDHAESGLHPRQWLAHTESLDIVDLPFKHSQLTSAEASVQIAAELDKRLLQYHTRFRLGAHIND